jgi:signal peptidase I
MSETSPSTHTVPWWTRLVIGKDPRKTVVRLVLLVFVLLFVFKVLLIPIRVSGLSMAPTYLDGRVNVVNHQAYLWKKPKRGDVIAFRLPEEGNAVLLKRIVGLPGERVSVVKGRPLINGEPLSEPYAVFGKNAPSSRREITLREDEYYVMGDNRSISWFRQIPEHHILGKVVF